MANSMQPEKQEVTECVEVSETVASVRDLKTELLHHLVNMSSAFQQNKPDEAAAKELIKKNACLVRELLNSSTVATNPAQAIGWKDVLVQKLLDGKVDLDDDEVKEFVNQKVEENSKKVNDIIDGIVNLAAAFKTSENTIKFVFEPNHNSKNASPYRSGSTAIHPIFVRGLRFSVTLHGPTTTQGMRFYLDCYDLPADKNCEATIKMTIKNQAGEQDFVRIFKKVFSSTKPTISHHQAYLGHSDAASYIFISNLITESEYANERLGLIKDGKMNFEVSVRVDELTDKPPATKRTVEQKVTSQ